MKQLDANFTWARCRGVIFDVDGTLIDSNDAHASAFVEALREHGYGTEFDTVRRLIGMGSDKLIPRAVGRPVSPEQQKSIGNRKKEIFHSRFLPRLRPFAGVRGFIEQLKQKGKRLGIATSAESDELSSLLRVAGVEDYFDRTATAGDAEESKPDPDIVQAAVKRLGLKPDCLVMIGDTPYDIDAGRRAGVPVIGVTCGGWAESALSGAVLVVNDVQELGEQLFRHVQEVPLVHPQQVTQRR